MALVQPHRGQPLYESSRACCEREEANEIQFIIPDKAHRRILLAKAGQHQWRLPGFLSEDFEVHSIPEVCGAARTVLGFQFRFIVLREAHSEMLDVTGPSYDFTLDRVVFVVECCEEPHALPPGYHWVPIFGDSQANVAQVVHSEEDAEQAIRQELQQITSDVAPPRRVPWASHGWHREILSWVRDVLSAHDLEVFGELEQIRVSSRSTVLKINTNRGAYFLKCSSCTSNDAGVTSVMSGAAPHLVAKPVVVDVERRLMILADHGDDFGWCALQPDGRRQAARDLARLHKASVPQFSKLVEVGLPVYSPLWMRDNFDRLLDAEELSHMRGSDLWRQVRGIKHKVCNALTKIAEWDMPMCLVHNDTCDGNLTRHHDAENGGFRFFDFDSSFGGHPVFDVRFCGLQQLEVYSKELNIVDTGSWSELSKLAYGAGALLDAFRYLDRVRAAEVGGARKDALDWLIMSFHSLALRFSGEKYSTGAL